MKNQMAQNQKANELLSGANGVITPDLVREMEVRVGKDHPTVLAAKAQLDTQQKQLELHQKDQQIALQKLEAAVKSNITPTAQMYQGCQEWSRLLPRRHQVKEALIKTLLLQRPEVCQPMRLLTQRTRSKIPLIFQKGRAPVRHLKMAPASLLMPRCELSQMSTPTSVIPRITASRVKETLPRRLIPRCSAIITQHW
jgi:hypothetical protein